MKFVTFETHTIERLGALVDGAVLDLFEASSSNSTFSSLARLVDCGVAALEAARELVRSASDDKFKFAGSWKALDKVHLLAPIPRPKKNVMCVGLNYRSHVEQNALALGQPIEIPDIPLFFSKPVTAVIGPNAPISADPRLTQKLDYEVELAVVVGKRGTWIAPEDVDGHIFGYTLVNDVSARDLQWRTSQFFYGKGLDTYCPMGPCVVTVDEMPPLSEIFLELFVNGEQRQGESAGNMIFSPQVAIAELSRGITLEPGDVISLGTPGGCGYQRVPPVFLQPGDVVECRSNIHGSLVNPVALPSRDAALGGSKREESTQC